VRRKWENQKKCKSEYVCMDGTADTRVVLEELNSRYLSEEM
jgi:hypothetical protein